MVYAALRVLYEPNAARKGVLTRQTADLWRAGKLTIQGDTFQNMPPVLSRPARDDTVTLQSHAPSPGAFGDVPYVQEERT